MTISTFRLAALTAALVAAGCSLERVGVPTAATAIPTQESATTTIAVRTAVLGSDVPLEGVTVIRDGEEVGVTDSAGYLTVTVPIGREVSVSVSKPGWISPIGPVGGSVQSSGERWEYWLHPVDADR